MMTGGGTEGLWGTFERRGSPYLAALARLAAITEIVPMYEDEQTVRAMARTNPWNSDAAGLLGAALSFAEQSSWQTWAVGDMSLGGERDASAAALLTARANVIYTSDLTSGMIDELSSASSGWHVLGHSECPTGGYPHPVVTVGREGDKVLVYNPANAGEQLDIHYLAAVEELAGSAALQGASGLLAVRPAQPERQGIVIPVA